MRYHQIWNTRFLLIGKYDGKSYQTKEYLPIEVALEEKYSDNYSLVILRHIYVHLATVTYLQIHILNVLLKGKAFIAFIICSVSCTEF